MIKTRAWPVRAMYMLVAFALVISLMISAAPSKPVAAAGHSVHAWWDRVTTPSVEGWVLAPDSQIIDYAVASEGEVAYAIVDGWDLDEDSKAIWLLKSTDHAATWKDITSGVKKELVKRGFEEDDLCWMERVASAPDDPDFVAVVLEICDDTAPYRVFISKDGGTTFRDSGPLDLDYVYDFAVSPLVAGERNLAIGGCDDTSPYSALLFRSEVTGDLATGWVDATEYDGWEDSNVVVAIQFAPSWATDKSILVVTIDAFDWDGYWEDSTVHLQSGTWGMVEGWNEEAGFKPAVPIITEVDVPDLGGFEAGIALPSDYAGRQAARRYA